MAIAAVRNAHGEQRIGAPDLKDLRFAALIGALLVYALFGTPTPDRPGFAEAATGLLLVLAAGLGRGAQVFHVAALKSWEKSGAFLLIYGLSVPVIIALLSGNAPSLMIRDLIPFVFLLLPLFLQPLAAAKAHYARPLTMVVVFVGVMFAARLLWPYITKQVYGMPADPAYLANAPTVLFAGLLCLGLAGQRLYDAASFSSLLRAATLCALAVLPLMAMALITQRATMGVMGLCLAAWLALGLVHRPVRALLPLAVCGVALAVFWPVLEDVYRSLMVKTSQVGLNMRVQEGLAVLEAVDDSLFTVLFGRGWGATFASPAVGGLTVNFTHSLLTGIFLKTGLCGLALALCWLAGLAVMLARLAFHRPILALALAGPFLIDIFLYASYKSLDFGLILLLISLWAPPRRQVARKAHL